MRKIINSVLARHHLRIGLNKRKEWFWFKRTNRDFSEGYPTIGEAYEAACNCITETTGQQQALPQLHEITQEFYNE